MLKHVKKMLKHARMQREHTENISMVTNYYTYNKTSDHNANRMN